MNYIRLSKEISYALRHNPCKYGLELDENGYVLIQQLLDALNKTKKYEKVLGIEDLYQVMQEMTKERFEIAGDKIRALYGHSMLVVIQKEQGIPPSKLYHGTTHKVIENIMKDGLKPMSRQYVHLSTDKETAFSVGKRRDECPILLEIDTIKAIEEGIVFYKGNDSVWLCDKVPVRCLKVI